MAARRVYTGSMRAKHARQGLVVGALLLLAFWLCFLIWGLAGKVRVALSEARDAKAQYAALEARKATLGADIKELETPRGRDEAIRTAFDVAKAGEEVIVVVPPEAPPPAPPKPWWRRWFGWL